MSSAIVESNSDERNRAKLDKLVRDYSANPEKMLNIGANNPLPEVSAVFAQTGINAVQQLNAMRPKTERANPFDSAPVPSAPEKAAYHNALNIAQQPLSILTKVKDGTITSNDIQALSAIHPQIYRSLMEKVQAQMIETIHKGQIIPYQTRLGLAVFLAQPLDSTMLPNSIIAAQPKNAPVPGISPPKQKGSTNALTKLPSMYQTPMGARTQRQTRDH